ncbi:MAG: glycosyltransferase family 4 protein [Acidobacteriota bacterium]
MKIAVDCYEVTEELTGVGRVIHNILLSLCSKESHEFFAYTRQKIEDYSNCTNIKQIVLPEDRGYFRWQNGAFFKEIKEKNPDLLIAPNYTLPFFFKSKSVLFEHDVSFASHSQWYLRRERFKKKYLVQRSLRKASLVVTLSEFSKQEITQCFSISPDKIRVLYLGVGERFKPAKEDEILKWKESRGLEGKKIIGYLGSIFNRRNVPLLVESVRLLRKEFPEVILYVVGKDLTYPPQDIKGILNENWIVWEENIPEPELQIYLSSLDVFAYLSEYEGFGLPPLESLACGTIPVLLKRSVLFEVYSDFSIMVENPDIKEVRDHLKRALTDKEKVNSRLSAFNVKRVYFSWDRVAEEFKTYINEVGSEG